MVRRNDFGGHHFDPKINAAKGMVRLNSHIRFGSPLLDWEFKNGAICPDFPAAGIFRFGVNFRDAITGWWGVAQNAAAEADFWQK